MIDTVDASDVPWKQDAFTLLFTKLYIDDTTWGPEKIAVTVQLQKMFPDIEWSKYCGKYLKNSNVLSPANFPILARLLKVCKIFSLMHIGSEIVAGLGFRGKHGD